MPRWMLCFIACALAVSCQEPGPARETFEQHPLPVAALKLDLEGRAGGTLRYPLVGEPSTFNPVSVQNTRDQLVSILTHATLLEADLAANSIGPGLADSYEMAADGLSATLKIRQGLFFSDGAPMTTQDVVFSLEIITHSDSASPLRDSLLFEGQSIRVENPDPQTVVLRLARPDASLESILSTIPVLPKHLLGTGSRPVERRWNLETPVEQIAGLGPFLIESHSPGRRTVLRRNPHYWKSDKNGQRLPYLDRIEMLYVPDVDNQVLRLQAGELDLVDQVLTPENFELLGQSGERIQTWHAGSSANLSLFWFNQNQPQATQGWLTPQKARWFGSVSFRKAIDHAIDRQTISQLVFQGKATPADSLVAEWNRRWRNPAVAHSPFDLSSALGLLEAEGFVLGKAEDGSPLLSDARGEPVRFELLTLNESLMRRAAAVIQQDLKQIGIGVSLRQEEVRAVSSRVVGSRRYDAVLTSFSLQADPSELANLLVSSGGMHLWNPRQPKPATPWEERVDQLMREQRSILDFSTRRSKVFEIQQILSQELPVSPVVFWDVLVAHEAGLKGLQPAPSSPCCLWNSWSLYFER